MSEEMYKESDFTDRGDVMIPRNFTGKDVFKEEVKIIRCFKQTKSNGEGWFPVMEVEAKDGKKFKVTAWARDIREIAKERGIKPEEWNNCWILLTLEDGKMTINYLSDPKEVTEEKIAE